MKPHQRKRRQQRKNRQSKAFRRAIIRALSNMPKVKLTDEEINRIRIALDYRKSNAKLVAPFPWEVENKKCDGYEIKDWPRPERDHYIKSQHHPANWPKPEDVARAIMEKEPKEWAFPKDLKTSFNFSNEEDEKRLQKIKEIINGATK